MNAQDPQLPPLAQALGRLRPRYAATPRTWPYAPRPAETAEATAETPPGRAPETPHAQPQNDFLRLLPEPALIGDLPPEKPAPERERLTAMEAIALAPVNRTYWFDL